MIAYTHGLQYEEKDGSWRDGFLAYTHSEAKDVAKEGRKRTGHKVRVIEISPEASRASRD